MFNGVLKIPFPPTIKNFSLLQYSLLLQILKNTFAALFTVHRMNFLFRIFITALAAYGLANVLKGIHVDTFWTALVFALILAVLNVLIKPILILLTLPLTIVTLGLFLFVVNTLVVLLASRLVDGFSIRNFWWGLLFALLLSLVSTVLFKEIEKEKD